jgi:hypothetical protein
MSEPKHPLDAYEDAAKVTIGAIASRIGYGRVQQIAGELWEAAWDCAPRGRMGVTIDDRLLPMPKPTKLRREARPDGGYNMVPAYTEAEMKAYAKRVLEHFAQKEST